MTLAADPTPAESRTYIFRAEIVGGSDNDKRLYCQGITWAFGDGSPVTMTPSRAPWTIDVKIQREFMISHGYKEPGRDVASFSYGPLSAQQTIDVKEL